MEINGSISMNTWTNTELDKVGNAEEPARTGGAYVTYLRTWRPNGRPGTLIH